MEFGWSRAGTAAIFTVGSIVYGFGSFPAGALIDRLGPRKLLPLASVTVAAGCLISAAAVEKWHFYIAYGVGRGIGTWAAGRFSTSPARTIGPCGSPSPFMP